MLRATLTTLLVTSAILTYSQRHVLPAPDHWEVEKFNFPIAFAPEIPFTGVEEVRFAPGWGDTSGDQRWSYCFLWWIHEDATFNAATLKKYLEYYYDGLIRSNLDVTKVPKEKQVATVASVSLGSNSSKPFSATVTMLDYMALKPLKLNIDVYVRDCSENGRRGIFFAVSPQSRIHPIWKDLDRIWQGFRCGE